MAAGREDAFHGRVLGRHDEERAFEAVSRIARILEQDRKGGHAR
jgi:hypothetical protein